MHQIDVLIKQLRQLPYSDMVQLATVLRDELAAGCGKMLDPHLIAKTMAGLQPGSVEESAETTMESRIIREIFQRKRTVTVAKLGSGYTMEILTVAGSQVAGNDLRVMFGQMLDQITTLSAMKR